MFLDKMLCSALPFFNPVVEMVTVEFNKIMSVYNPSNPSRQSLSQFL